MGRGFFLLPFQFLTFVYMRHGNVNFRGWVRLCVLLVSLFHAVRAGAAEPPLIDQVFVSTHVWGGIMRTEVKVLVSAVEVVGGVSRVTLQYSGTTYADGWCCGDFIRCLYRVDGGAWGSVLFGLQGSQNVHKPFAGSVVVSVPVRGKLELQLEHAYYAGTDYATKMDYSVPWVPKSVLMCLSWEVPNNTAAVRGVGVWVEGDDGWAWQQWPLSVPQQTVEPGKKAVVKFWTLSTDTGKFRAGLLERPGTLGLTQYWPGGVATSVRQGTCFVAGALKDVTQGTQVEAVDPVPSGASGFQLPSLGATLSIGADGIQLAVGATANEVSQAGMSQAHADALAIQSSIEGIRTQMVTGSGAAAGSGSGAAAGDSEAAAAAAVRAESVRATMDGTAATDAASATAQTVAGQARGQGVQAVSLFSVSSLAGAVGTGEFQAVGYVQGDAPVAPSSSYVSVNMGAGQTPLKFMTNPFAADGPFNGAIGVCAQWIRKLVLWGLVITFFAWVLSRLREMCGSVFSSAPFGDSIVTSVNSIKVLGSGGGIGYAVKLIAYAVVGAILLTMPLVTLIAVTEGLPWLGMKAIMSDGLGSLGAGTPILSQALWYVDQVIPWRVCLGAPIWYFVVESVLFPSQLFWMTFVKFLPT